VSWQEMGISPKVGRPREWQDDRQRWRMNKRQQRENVREIRDLEREN